MTRERLAALFVTTAGIATALAALDGVPDRFDVYLAGAAIVLTGLSGWLMPQLGGSK